MRHKTNTAQGTVPDRSNLTLNVLLERKWNAVGMLLLFSVAFLMLAVIEQE